MVFIDIKHVSNWCKCISFDTGSECRIHLPVSLAQPNFQYFSQSNSWQIVCA